MTETKNYLRAVKPAESTNTRRFSLLQVQTLEYNLTARLVAQHFQTGGAVNYNALLSIPLAERLPNLVQSVGKRTVHRLLVKLLNEFQYALRLPKAKRLTETKVSVAAVEIILSAAEDQLAIEDVILFFERAKAGVYGPIRNLTSTATLFAKFEKYRQERHQFFMDWKRAEEASFKAENVAVPRTAPEPTALGDLLHQQDQLLYIPNRA